MFSPLLPKDFFLKKFSTEPMAEQSLPIEIIREFMALEYVMFLEVKTCIF